MLLHIELKGGLGVDASDTTYHGPDGDEAVLRVHEDHEEQRHRGDLLSDGEGVDHVEPQVGLSHVGCSMGIGGCRKGEKFGER